MFEVSEKASEAINKFMEGREGLQSIRILMDEGGWKGPHLIMALDEKRENDQVFTERGVTFLIEKALFDRAKPISIDHIQSDMGPGFIMNSELVKSMKGDNAICENICETCYPHG